MKKPSKEDKMLAKVVVEVFCMPKSKLDNDKEVISLANQVRGMFERMRFRLTVTNHVP
jgi:hypothetical protein